MFADDASRKKFVNQVLRELHDHYTSTYHSYHERLGVIVVIVGEFRVSFLDVVKVDTARGTIPYAAAYHVAVLRHDRTGYEG